MCSSRRSNLQWVIFFSRDKASVAAIAVSERASIERAGEPEGEEPKQGSATISLRAMCCC